MDTEVENWISNLTVEQRNIANRLREIILTTGPDLTEEFKWKQPCYSGNSLVRYLPKASDHVTLGFFAGADTHDYDIGGFLSWFSAGSSFRFCRSRDSSVDRLWAQPQLGRERVTFSGSRRGRT